MTTEPETAAVEPEIVEADVVEPGEVELVEDTGAIAILDQTPKGYTPSRIEGGLAHFEQYMMLADRIARTQMVPTALRGQPDQVLAVVMYGAELGLGPMQALQQINFIEGKPAVAPELMRALIRQAGHKLKITQSDTRCVIEGTRGDTGEVDSTEFTIHDAVRARLCRIDDEGNVTARSSQGKVLPWEAYTRDMLLARATSRIARMMFSDVIAGMSYTPEEVRSFAEPAEAPAQPARPRRAARSSAPTSTARRSPIAADEGRPVTGFAEVDPDDDGTLASVEIMDRIKASRASLKADEKARLHGEWAGAGLPDDAASWTQRQAEKAWRIAAAILDGGPGGFAPETGDGVTPGAPRATRGAAGVTAPKATKAQIGTIWGRLRDLGFEDDALAHHRVSGIVGREIGSLNDLKKAEASQVIDQLVLDVEALDASRAQQ